VRQDGLLLAVLLYAPDKLPELLALHQREGVGYGVKFQTAPFKRRAGDDPRPLATWCRLLHRALADSTMSAKLASVSASSSSSPCRRNSHTIRLLPGSDELVPLSFGP